nr:Crp/Fnr family transcriptional regulator [uncultured Holophaga sp.]
MDTPKTEAAVLSHGWYSEMPAHLSGPLLKQARIRRYRQSEQILQAGERARGMYCILRGLVLMTASSPNGKTTIPFSVEVQNWFGCIEVINGNPYPLNAIAATECELLFIPGSAVEALGRTSPELWFYIGRLLARQTLKIVNNLMELLYLPAPARVAKRLHALSLREGGPNGTYQLRTIHISHDQLGCMLSLSRQIVSKILKGFEKEELIICGYKCIDILSTEKLSAKIESLTRECLEG